MSEDCILLHNIFIYSGCVKKACLPPWTENETDTCLVYEGKVPFPLGATLYCREIWNTTSLTACSDNTASARGWERSELQNLHLKDWAVTSLLQADNKKCPWKPFLCCLSNNPWAKNLGRCELQRIGKYLKWQGESSSFPHFSPGSPPW